MPSVRFEERSPGGGDVRSSESRTSFDSAVRRIHELEASLEAEKRKAKRTSKAVTKIYQRGGIVRRTDHDGNVKVTTYTGDPDKDKIHVDSLRGRFIAHVTRHL